MEAEGDTSRRRNRTRTRHPPPEIPQISPQSSHSTSTGESATLATSAASSLPISLQQHLRPPPPPAFSLSQPRTADSDSRSESSARSAGGPTVPDNHPSISSHSEPQTSRLPPEPRQPRAHVPSGSTMLQEPYYPRHHREDLRRYPYPDENFDIGYHRGSPYARYGRDYDSYETGRDWERGRYTRGSERPQPSQEEEYRLRQAAQSPVSPSQPRTYYSHPPPPAPANWPSTSPSSHSRSGPPPTASPYQHQSYLDTSPRPDETLDRRYMPIPVSGSSWGSARDPRDSSSRAYSYPSVPPPPAFRRDYVDSEVPLDPSLSTRDRERDWERHRLAPDSRRGSSYPDATLNYSPRDDAGAYMVGPTRDDSHMGQAVSTRGSGRSERSGYEPLEYSDESGRSRPNREPGEPSAATSRVLPSSRGSRASVVGTGSDLPPPPRHSQYPPPPPIPAYPQRPADMPEWSSGRQPTGGRESLSHSPSQSSTSSHHVGTLEPASEAFERPARPTHAPRHLVSGSNPHSISHDERSRRAPPLPEYLEGVPHRYGPDNGPRLRESSYRVYEPVHPHYQYTSSHPPRSARISDPAIADEETSLSSRTRAFTISRQSPPGYPSPSHHLGPRQYGLPGDDDYASRDFHEPLHLHGREVDPRSRPSGSGRSRVDYEYGPPSGPPHHSPSTGLPRLPQASYLASQIKQESSVIDPELRSPERSTRSGEAVPGYPSDRPPYGNIDPRIVPLSHPGIAGPSSGLVPMEDISDDDEDDAFSPGKKASSSRAKGKTKARSKPDEKGKNKRASSEEEFEENKPKKVPRQKIEVACDYCRGRKMRCDGARPQCSNCMKNGVMVCKYAEGVRRRGPGKKPKVAKPRKRTSNSQSAAEASSNPTGNPELSNVSQQERRSRTGVATGGLSSGVEFDRAQPDQTALAYIAASQSQLRVAPGHRRTSASHSTTPGGYSPHPQLMTPDSAISPHAGPSTASASATSGSWNRTDDEFNDDEDVYYDDEEEED